MIKRRAKLPPSVCLRQRTGHRLWRVRLISREAISEWRNFRAISPSDDTLIFTEIPPESSSEWQNLLIVDKYYTSSRSCHTPFVSVSRSGVEYI